MSVALQDDRLTAFFAAQRQLVPNANGHYPLRALLDLASEVSGVSIREMAARRHAQRLCRPRWLYFWLARRFTPYSFQQVTALLGGRDHATVINGLHRMEDVIVEIGLPPADTPHAWAAHFAASWSPPAKPKSDRQPVGTLQAGRIRQILAEAEGPLPRKAIKAALASRFQIRKDVDSISHALGRLKRRGEATNGPHGWRPLGRSA